MIVEPVTLPPGRPVARRAARSWSVQHLGRADHRRGRSTRRHPHQPRPPLRGRHRRPVSELMTREGLVTVPVGTSLEEARAVLHKHKIEKLPVVDDGWPARRAHHGQGHREADRSTRTRRKDERGRLRVGAAVGAGPRASSGSPRWSTAGRRRARRRHVARPLARRDRDGARSCKRRLRRRRSSPATSPPPEGTRGPDRRRGRRRQGGDRARARSARRASSPASACRRSPPSTTAPRWPTGTACR